MITSNQPKMSGPGVPLPTKIMVDSHDTKPTNVKNGAKLKEIDTGKEFIYNEGTSSWDEQPNNGGEGGYEYEEGIFTPESDINNPAISFVNEHTDKPIFVYMGDYGETVPADNSLVWFVINNWYTIYGQPVGGTYGVTRSGYLSSSGTSVSTGGNSLATLDQPDSITSLAYYLQNTGFKCYSASSRYFRANRSYKWIAIWKPKSDETTDNDNAEQGDVR